MRVLVAGAGGFIGSHIVAALRAHGHDVVAATRRSIGQAAHVACDMSRDTAPETWLPRLAGIDAVVNCAGILRERGADRFETVHVAAPLALFRACETLGIRRVIQISALGEPGDGEFVASKHRCDAALMALDLDAVILRPGLVYAARGSYGGTSLLRGLASLPGVLFLPGDGCQRLQPIAADDVAAATLAALARPEAARQTIELAGPDVLALRDYLAAWRDWLGLPAARCIAVPAALVGLATRIGEALGRGPLSRVVAAMLERGSVAAPGAIARMESLLALRPQALTQVLAAAPAQQQDRWHARLYLLKPVLHAMLVFVFALSGLLGLLLPATTATAAMAHSGLADTVLVALARGGGAVDLALAFALLVGWRPRATLLGMGALVLGYTIVIGVLASEHWLDPFGGLLKNLLVLPLLLVALALEDRR